MGRVFVAMLGERGFVHRCGFTGHQGSMLTKDGLEIQGVLRQINDRGPGSSWTASSKAADLEGVEHLDIGAAIEKSAWSIKCRRRGQASVALLLDQGRLDLRGLKGRQSAGLKRRILIIVEKQSLINQGKVVHPIRAIGPG